MKHVEILRNEWSAGRQRVVARLVVNGDDHVVIDGAESWVHVVPESFVDPLSGETFDRNRGTDYIVAIHRYLNGDYVFATEAHDEGECEFEVGTEIPLAPAAGMTTPAHQDEAAPGRAAQPA